MYVHNKSLGKSSVVPLNQQQGQSPPLLSKPFPHPQEAGGVGSVGQRGPEEAARALGPAQPFLDRGCEQIP